MRTNKLYKTNSKNVDDEKSPMLKGTIAKVIMEHYNNLMPTKTWSNKMATIVAKTIAKVDGDHRKNGYT